MPAGGTCAGRCGVYTEGGGPVLILSGAGLDVEDDDHNEIFDMQVSMCMCACVCMCVHDVHVEK